MRRKLTYIVIGVALLFSACGSTDTNIEGQGTNTNGQVQKGTIEITIDNWEDYFEVKQTVQESKNAFDEVKTIWLQHVLSLKSEYSKRLKDADIAVEFVETQVSVCSFEYNTETKELTIGDPFTEDEMKTDSHSYGLSPEVYTDTRNFDKADFESEKDGYGCILGGGHGGYTDSYKVNGNIVTWDGIAFSTEISRIQGTLILK